MSSNVQKASEGGSTRPIMGGYVAFATLWVPPNEKEGALFPSELSARWFVRTHRQDLLAAEAIAIHLKRLLVHPERFESVVRGIALSAAARKLPR